MTYTSASEDDGEYQQLIDDVSANVKELMNLYTKISNSTDGLGKQNDTPKLRSELQQSIDTANRIEKETKATLKRLATLSANLKDKKTKVDKLTADVTKFTDRLRATIKTASEKLLTPGRGGPGGGGGAPTLASGTGRPEDTQRYSRSHDEDGDQQGLLASGRQDDTQIQLDDDLDMQDDIIRDRNRHIKTIHGQMVQVNEIFQDIARLVQDQSETIDSIQTNIVTASDHVDSGVKEIKDADKSQQSSRKKLCFLAIFITVVVAVVIIAVVLLSRKSSS